MNSKEILEYALKLGTNERFLIVEGLLNSIDEPNVSLDKIWSDEAEKRLNTYREGRLEGIPIEEIFNEK